MVSTTEALSTCCVSMWRSRSGKEHCNAIAKLKFALSDGSVHYTCLGNHAHKFIESVPNDLKVSIYEMKRSKVNGVKKILPSQIPAYDNIDIETAKNISYYRRGYSSRFLKVHQNGYPVLRFTSSFSSPLPENASHVDEFIHNLKYTLDYLEATTYDYKGKKKVYVDESYSLISSLVSNTNLLNDKIKGIDDQILALVDQHHSHHNDFYEEMKQLNEDRRKLHEAIVLLHQRIQFKLPWNNKSKFTKECSICMDGVEKRGDAHNNNNGGGGGGGGMLKCNHVFQRVLQHV